MNTRPILSVLLLLAAAAAPARAQDMTSPKPRKEHELLKQFAGEWDATAKFMGEPGKDPVVSKSRESARIIAGGLFLVFDDEGEMFGQKFTGHGTMGYDVHKKKFTGTWVDSLATGIYLIESTVDETGKIFTEWMEGADPNTGKPMKMKMVHEVKDKDTRVLHFFMDGPDGKEIETGAIEYRRRP